MFCQRLTPVARSVTEDFGQSAGVHRSEPRAGGAEKTALGECLFADLRHSGDQSERGHFLADCGGEVARGLPASAASKIESMKEALSGPETQEIRTTQFPG